MKFTLILATLVAFFGAASALSLEKRQETGECQLGVRQLFAPDRVTPGQPFHVKYCTETYFKRSSNSTILTVSRNETDFEFATVVARKEFDYWEDNDGYEWDVTLQIGGITFAKQSWLKVFEIINDMYTPHSIHTFTKPVTIKYAS